jgi:hypothetical protein
LEESDVMDKVQETLDKLNGSNVSTGEIERCLDSGNILIKANAIMAIVRLNIYNDKIISQLSKIARNIDNESRVIGAWNSGHFALIALKLLNTEKSKTLYEQIISSLHTSQQEALERLLTEWPQ